MGAVIVSRIISPNDPYKVNNSYKLQGVILNPKPMRVVPLYIPVQKGIEKL